MVQLSSEYLQGSQLLLGGGRASQPGAFYQDCCRITQQTPSSARLAGVNSESRLRPIPTVRLLLNSGGHRPLRGFTPLPAASSCAEVQSKMCQMACTACKNNLCTWLLPLRFDSGSCAIRKTLTVASKTSKTIPARWLVSNLKQMPLAMKFQISNEKSQIFPYTTQSCNALGKLVATYKVAASLFCAAQSLFRSIVECCGDL